MNVISFQPAFQAVQSKASGLMRQQLKQGLLPLASTQAKDTVTFRGRGDDYDAPRNLSPSEKKYGEALALAERVTQQDTPKLTLSKRAGQIEKLFAEAVELGVKEGNANLVYSVGLVNHHGVERFYENGLGGVHRYHQLPKTADKGQAEPLDKWIVVPNYELGMDYFRKAAQVAQKTGDSWTMMNVARKFSDGLRRHSADRPSLPITPEMCHNEAKDYLGQAVSLARRTLADVPKPENFRVADNVKYAVGVLRKVDDIYRNGAEMDRYDDARKTFPPMPEKAEELAPLLAKFAKVVV